MMTLDEVLVASDTSVADPRKRRFKKSRKNKNNPKMVPLRTQGDVAAFLGRQEIRGLIR